jgi:KTSC domain
MRRARVQSSNIRSVGYDLDEHVLEIEFHNGGVYDYLDVPPEEALALLESDSLGRYLNAAIKPRYRYRPVRRAS